LPKIEICDSLAAILLVVSKDGEPALPGTPITIQGKAKPGISCNDDVKNAGAPGGCVAIFNLKIFEVTADKRF
jgi:hypothetical protein